MSAIKLVEEFLEKLSNNENFTRTSLLSTAAIIGASYV